MRVPNRLGPDEAQAWVDESVGGLRTAWETAWRPEFEDALREMLAGAQANRPEDALLDLVYWPYFRPLAVRVGVRAGTSTSLQSWIDAGFRVDSYEGAEIGPGLQCVASQDFRAGDSTVTLVHAHYVFDDGQESVVVTVEPTLAEMFAHMAPGLHGLIGTLDVRREDGSAFSACAVPGYTRSAMEEWEVATDG